MVFFIWEKCICTSKCHIHFAECPDLKPLTGCSRSMRRKAGDSSPERQESIHDTEASKRAGESCGYMYIVIWTNVHAWCSLYGKSAYVLYNKCNVHFTECPDLKPLTGRSRSMRRKAGDSSPERQESIHDTEASKRAGESCGYMYIVIWTNVHAWCSLYGKSAHVLYNKCNVHFTECPDLKPLTGRSRSMRRKAGDSSPERQESIHDTEASKRAGESCGYMYIVIWTNVHAWCSLYGKSAHVNVTCTLQSVRT